VSVSYYTATAGGVATGGAATAGGIAAAASRPQIGLEDCETGTGEPGRADGVVRIDRHVLRQVFGHPA
jgi:hypothetical protein